jgi:hypothetical protein
MRNLGQIRLCVWHKQIFGLCAVDGVPESPATDRLDTFAVAALRPLRADSKSFEIVMRRKPRL